MEEGRQSLLLFFDMFLEISKKHIAQLLRRRDLVPLTRGVKFRIAIASAVVFFFGNLACFQLGGSCAPCGKHSVKLRYVASFVDVIYIPVVEKQILWSKRCKDESLRGTVKEIIQQVSMSKKWASKPVLDENSTPILSAKGKPVFKKSYSVLQDDFFRYMRDAGYDDVERGERGSSEEHLTVTQFKVQQEQAWLAELTEQNRQQEQ